MKANDKIYNTEAEIMKYYISQQSYKTESASQESSETDTTEYYISQESSETEEIEYHNPQQTYAKETKMPNYHNEFFPIEKKYHESCRAKEYRERSLLDLRAVIAKMEGNKQFINEKIAMLSHEQLEHLAREEVKSFIGIYNNKNKQQPLANNKGNQQNTL